MIIGAALRSICQWGEHAKLNLRFAPGENGGELDGRLANVRIDRHIGVEADNDLATRKRDLSEVRQHGLRLTTGKPPDTADQSDGRNADACQRVNLANAFSKVERDGRVFDFGEHSRMDVE